MSTGKLKWYNGAKGFGFIVPSDGSKDVFVHVTAFKEAGITKIDQGQALEFEIKEHNGKPVATALKLLESPGDESAEVSTEAKVEDKAEETPAESETPAQ
tara:strand:+ start:1158 stop:1457 length:300 start_codon:yes stop_codon:yes gene_type:complete